MTTVEKVLSAVAAVLVLVTMFILGYIAGESVTSYNRYAAMYEKYNEVYEEYRDSNNRKIELYEKVLELRDE